MAERKQKRGVKKQVSTKTATVSKKKTILPKQEIPQKSTYRIRPDGVLWGLIAYFMGIFAINFFSRGLTESLLLNPIQAIEFISEQITTIIGIPVWIAQVIGFLLTTIFFFFGYVISEEIKRMLKNK